ncbi:MAG: FG-GAP repeat domain-containing protein [Pirellulaceae bacterium]
MRSGSNPGVWLVGAVLWIGGSCLAQELALRDQELGTRLEVGYAVRLIDMNADQRLDIAIVDSKRFLWLENPNWQEHVMFEDKAARNDNVCFAPHDIDGDGRIDFAVGRDWQPNNTESGGTIGWIRQPENPAATWTYHPIADEPTTHRMQFVDLDTSGRPQLVVSPLKGRQTKGPDFDSAGVRQLAFTIPAAPASESWPVTVLNDSLHVTHNFWPVQWDRDSPLEVLFVSFGGVHLLDHGKDGTWHATRIGAGDQESRPNRGASEIKTGVLGGGQRFIATIEPWHGDKVVVYREPRAQTASDGLWTRHVLDAELKWGHAVSCADLDQDGRDELVIGVRDDLDAQDPTKRRGLRIYGARDPDGGRWSRQIVDPGSVAIEDLAVGDLNGDQRLDIVAVGRQTHNVKIYWNETRRSAP